MCYNTNPIAYESCPNPDPNLKRDNKHALQILTPNTHPEQTLPWRHYKVHMLGWESLDLGVTLTSGYA